MSDRAASRYIKSLLGLAVEKGQLDAVHKDMQLFTTICKENRGFASMLKSPVIRHEKKLSILEKIFSSRVSDITMGFIEIITRKNREPILQLIASQFHNAYNEYKGVGQASITTTIPMDAALRKDIEAIVKRLCDKKLVEVKEAVDKELIGGFILNVGDRRIDASVKTKLRTLALKFNEHYFVKDKN